MATVFNYHKKEVTPKTLVPLVFLPKKQGSFQEEMVATVRQFNLLAVGAKTNLASLFKEVENGNPVLVLQNLGLDWLPKWHYSVLIGYDIEQKYVILRSGEAKRWITPIDVFERTWARSNYWALMITPLNQLPITATDEQILNSAVAFEELGKTSQANKVYYQATIKWPKHYMLNMGLGNTAYGLHKFQQAESAFLSAIKINPSLAAAWNNLAYAQVKLNKNQLAETAINTAIRIAKNKASYIQSKKELFTHP